MLPSGPLDTQQSPRVDCLASNPLYAINPGANRCRTCFQEICLTLGNLAPEEAIKAGIERETTLLFFQDAKAKFNAWGSNIAAFHSIFIPTSLGFRLRDAPEIRKRVWQVLEELLEYLIDCG